MGDEKVVRRVRDDVDDDVDVGEKLENELVEDDDDDVEYVDWEDVDGANGTVGVSVDVLDLRVAVVEVVVGRPSGLKKVVGKEVSVSVGDSSGPAVMSLMTDERKLNGSCLLWTAMSSSSRADGLQRGERTGRRGRNGERRGGSSTARGPTLFSPDDVRSRPATSR